MQQRSRRLGLLIASPVVLIVALALVAMVDFGQPPRATPSQQFEVVAHRGVYQNYSRENLDNQTCTAERILSPIHGFLENTLASIAEAFRLGATVVEVDIQVTSDERIAVFHDWTIDCRTEGTGETRRHTLAYLQTLDIGYGYTADGGATFPFRGKGVGLMPSLEQVLDGFPEHRFMIDQKETGSRATTALGGFLATRPAAQRARLYYYGPPSAIADVRRYAPEVRRLVGTRGEVRQCVVALAWRFFLGALPPACRDLGLGAPVAYLDVIPGWPNRFLRKVFGGGSRFFAVDVNSEAELHAVSGLPISGIITERIEAIAPGLSEIYQ